MRTYLTPAALGMFGDNRISTTADSLAAGRPAGHRWRPLTTTAAVTSPRHRSSTALS